MAARRPRVLRTIVLALGASALGLLAVTSPVVAQVPPLVGRGAYVLGTIGVPSPDQVIDVRWSGDRRGEFTGIGQLPPAFRGLPPAPRALARVRVN